LAVVHVVDVDRVGGKHVLVVLDSGCRGGRRARRGRLGRVVARRVERVHRVGVGRGRREAAVGVGGRGPARGGDDRSVAADGVARDADVVARGAPRQVDLGGPHRGAGQPLWRGGWRGVFGG